MMQMIKQKSGGFTLLAVILMLIIGSMLAVYAFKTHQVDQEKKASQIYGQKLYVFGQAVREYVYVSAQTPGTSNPYTTGYLIGTTYVPDYFYNDKLVQTKVGNKITLTGTGVDWLKQVNAGVDPHNNIPYLDDTFTFGSGLSPLKLALPDKDGKPGALADQSITTTITFDKSQPTVLPMINIDAGTLYENKPQNNSFILKPDLTQNAVKRANTMFSPYLGSAAVNYVYNYIVGGNPTPQNPIKGVNVPPGAVNEAYLRIDGNNSMLASFTFDQTPAGIGTYQIQNVEGIEMPTNSAADSSIKNLNTITLASNLNGNLAPKIEFTEPGGSITSLATLIFGSSNLGAISDLFSLAFEKPILTSQGDIDPTTATSISALHQIIFDNSASSTMTGLSQITFANNRKFRGIVTSYCSLDNKGIPIDREASCGEQDICGLTVARWQPGNVVYSAMGATTLEGGCTVSMVAFNEKMWFMTAKAGSTCSAICLRYTS